MSKIPVIDGHNDTLTKAFDPDLGEKYSIFDSNENGQFDIPRATKGGMVGGFFSIYTPPAADSPERDQAYGAQIFEYGYNVKPRSPIELQYACKFTDAVFDYVEKINSNPQIRIVRDYSELSGSINGDYMAIILHIEGAEAIDCKFKQLEKYYDKGLRSLGPVWSRPNIYGEGIPFRYPSSPDTGPGLTIDGRRLIGACNEMGIMIDLAHLNEQGFRDVKALSHKPLVVTHGAVHSLCRSSRNITDFEIDAIADSGGVLGIFFEPININLRIAPDLSFFNDVSLDEIVKHFDYVIKRIGPDFVAIGSDFDGADMPSALKDVSFLPDLISAFSRKGYSDEIIKKIAFENWLRVLRETLS